MTLTGTGLVPITRVDFSASDPTSVLRLSSFGVTASVVADQSALVQAAFDACLSGMKLWMDVSGSIRVDSTVTLLDRRNIEVQGLVPVGRTDSNQPTCKFIWYGANGGTVLRIDRVRDSLFRGIGVFGAATAGTGNGADTGWFITQDGAGTNISSANTFEYCYSAANSTRSGWRSFDVSNASGANNEQHVFSHCGVVGGNQAYPNMTGTGFYLGHTNVKQTIIRRCQRIGLAKFVESANGSFRAEYNFGGTCTKVYSGGITDACSIIGDDAESDTQFFDMSGSGNVPVFITGCRIENLAGGQAASGTTTVDPVFNIQAGIHLTVTNSKFSALSGPFSSTFLNNTSGSMHVNWINNEVSLTPEYILDVGFRTFQSAFASDKYGVRTAGYFNPGLYSVAWTRPTNAQMISLARLGRDDFISMGTVDSLTLGTGEIEIGGLLRPNQPTATIVGTPGSTSYILAVLARDALGNRTFIGPLNQNITTANATLSGSNYIKLDWPAVPGATDYILVQFSGGTWRTVGSPISASGTNYETYNVVANPSGAFTYVAPTYNETATVITRARRISPVEIPFTANDATPSIAQGSDFVTANSGATSITTFDDGATGQVIRVRVNDVNTTIVNGSGILTGTGANVTTTNGLIYSFIRRGGNWISLSL